MQSFLLFDKKISMSNSSEFSQPYSLPLGGRVGDGAAFNSKLLLFGEYGLMFDAMALSVPFPKFSGRLAFDESGIHRASTAEIMKFSDHLQKEGSGLNLHFPLNPQQLKHDLMQGLYFDSNIPQQYGVGSSGALVAALYGKYAVPADENLFSPELLRADFAVLESFFHGRSSGLDPLISYLNKPLLIDTQKQICPVEFDLNDSGLVLALIDTRTTGATGPLVQHFIDRFNDPEFEKAFELQFIPANNGCINTMLNGDHSSFFGHLGQLIRFQLQHFRRMIPENFQIVVSEALNDQIFVKLLGSGGGGFLLAFAETESNLKSWSEKTGIDLLWITNSYRATSNNR